MLRYAITNLSALPAHPPLGAAETRHAQWLADLRRWAAQRVDFVQLREKTLDAGEQTALATAAMALLHGFGSGNGIPESERPRLLLNGRPDIAAAARADGVHLPSRPGELTPAQVRSIFRAAGLPHCTVSVSCHNLDQVERAREGGADLVLFSPVFEKSIAGSQVAEGTGLGLLAAACQLASPLPLLGLGGINVQNTSDCLAVGAAGVAGIRLFS